MGRVYIAVKHAEACLWTERMEELKLHEGPELLQRVPKYALDKDYSHVCYPPELLTRY